MIKLIARIAIILAAAALVSGIAYLAVSGAGSGASVLGEGGGGDQLRRGMAERPGRGLGRQLPAAPEGTPPLAALPERRGLHESQAGSSWSRLLAQLGKVALVTAAVLALQQLVRFIRRRRKALSSTAEG